MTCANMFVIATATHETPFVSVPARRTAQGVHFFFGVGFPVMYCLLLDIDNWRMLHSDISAQLIPITFDSSWTISDMMG